MASISINDSLAAIMHALNVFNEVLELHFIPFLHNELTYISL